MSEKRIFMSEKTFKKVLLLSRQSIIRVPSQPALGKVHQDSSAKCAMGPVEQISVLPVRANGIKPNGGNFGEVAVVGLCMSALTC